MYDFSSDQRTALEELPTRTSRLVVERWTELTHEDTHPYWRCKPQGVDLELLSVQLDAAVRQDDHEVALKLIPMIAGGLLARGSRDWQHNSVKTFLIDPNRKNRNLDFFTRLRRFSSGEGRPDAADVNVSLQWRISGALPAPLVFPAIGPVPLGADGRTYDLVTIRDGGEAYLGIQTVFRGDHVRAVARASAALHVYGSSLLDLVRVTHGEAELLRGRGITIHGSRHMSYVRERPIPRVRTRAHAQRAVERVVHLVQRGSSPHVARRLLGAARWFSTAVSRWQENPVFATAILWMALEAIFGKCVIDHTDKKCRHKRQHTAVDVYSSHLVASLTDELEAYLFRRAMRMKMPQEAPERRGKNAPRAWLKAIPHALCRKEPLLASHRDELLSFDRKRVEAARQSSESDLRALKKMRNELAHEGDAIVADEHADYLAAFVSEILFLCFEDSASLLIEEAA